MPGALPGRGWNGRDAGQSGEGGPGSEPFGVVTGHDQQGRRSDGADSAQRQQRGVHLTCQRLQLMFDQVDLRLHGDSSAGAVAIKSAPGVGVGHDLGVLLICGRTMT